jgi:hypothetical protein
LVDILGLRYEVLILEVLTDPYRILEQHKTRCSDGRINVTNINDAERAYVNLGRYLGWPLTNMNPGGQDTHVSHDLTRERLRKTTRESWLDPEIRARRMSYAQSSIGITANRQRALRQFADPKHYDQVVAQLRAMAKDPIMNERRRQLTIKQFENPERRELNRQQAIALMKDVTFKRRAISGLLKWSADPTNRSTISTRLKLEMATNPERRASAAVQLA